MLIPDPSRFYRCWFAEALQSKLGTLSLEAQSKLEKDTAKKEAKAEAKADAAKKKKMVCCLLYSCILDVSIVDKYSEYDRHPKYVQTIVCCRPTVHSSSGIRLHRFKSSA